MLLYMPSQGKQMSDSETLVVGLERRQILKEIAQKVFEIQQPSDLNLCT